MPAAQPTMPELDFQQLLAQPAWATLAVDIALQATMAEDVATYLQQTLTLLTGPAAAELALVATYDHGKWRVLGQTGTLRYALPVDLLGDLLDQGRLISRNAWLGVPLFKREGRDVLLVRTTQLAPGAAPVLRQTQTMLETLAPLVAYGLQCTRAQHTQQRQMQQLERVLTISQQWNQTHEMQPLLEQMALAATQLLKADRASIFLWDRDNRILIGRPALGIESGELRIPDDQGIVGEVIRTGQPRRVSIAENETISRQVDTKSGYRTENLICVPLRGQAGELFGAFEVLNRISGDFDQDDETILTELAKHAAIALENTQAWEELLTTHQKLVDQAAADVRMIGQSPVIQALRLTIERVAATDLAVLVLGENGTGKEVISQSIHYLSPRRNQPFIAVNCAAITETLLESELFGHEKGAFTDAHEARAGKFELATGGTLFLDEIGDLSKNGQAKLLRVLEEKVVVRVGGSRPIHTDVRVIAATNQNLAQMVRERRFREDLYFRLNVVSLDLPALRERGDDILLLADHFLQGFSRQARRKSLKLTSAAQKRLLVHSWPGNVRELRNLMERLAYLSPSDKIDEADLAFILSPHTAVRQSEEAFMPEGNMPLTSATEHFQVEFIRRAIQRTRSNMTEAAKLLGLHRSNLYRKMRQLGMETSEDESLVD